MIIKNIVEAQTKIHQLMIPSWVLIDGYKINDCNKYEKIIELNETIITKEILFTDGLDNIVNGNIQFNVFIYKRNGNYFDSTPLYSFINKRYIDLVDNKFVMILEKNKLIPDGEYIVKVIFDVINFPSALIKNNEFYRIDQLSRKIYGNANYEDWYFSIYYKPQTPSITSGVLLNDNINTLKSFSFITEKSTTSFLLPTNYSGDILLSVGGITMSEEYDYNIDNGIVLFKDVIPSDTVINVTYSGGDSKNGLTKETFNIISTEYKNSNKSFEGDYFKYDDGKFGIFLSKFISDDSTPHVIINGITLSNELDYSIDKNDRRKIKLNGILYKYDVIDVYYVSEYTTLHSNTNIISGKISIEQPINNEKGKFLLKISKEYDFNEEIGTIPINYSEGESEFDFNIILNEPGVYYIKVINRKDIILLENETFSMVIGNTIKIDANF